MSHNDMIDLEIRNQAVHLYGKCAALFELPRLVYAKIIEDNKLRKKPFRVSFERIQKAIHSMPEFQQ